MKSKIKVVNLGVISIYGLLHEILPQYHVSLNDLGITPPQCKADVQLYKWLFTVDKPIDTIAAYFNEEEAVKIVADVGKPALKQFELDRGEKLRVGAKGSYWIKKTFTIAKGKFVITHNGLYNGVLRLGYIRLEDLGRNWSLIGLLDKSGFGFSIFEFCSLTKGTTSASYMIAQQLPGHIWGKALEGTLKKKLNNPSFLETFMTLKRNIEYFQP